jgi:hypothetical protein
MVGAADNCQLLNCTMSPLDAAMLRAAVTLPSVLVQTRRHLQSSKAQTACQHDALRISPYCCKHRQLVHMPKVRVLSGLSKAMIQL